MKAKHLTSATTGGIDETSGEISINASSCKDAHVEENSATAQVEKTELARTDRSWDDVKLPEYLRGRPELVAMKYVFPAGEKLSWHHHPVINFGVLVEGELTIIGQDGKEKVVHEGEVVVEMVNSVHRGENRGKTPAVLYMFYLSQENRPLSVPHPEITK